MPPHIEFIVWVCLYPVCIAITRLIYTIIIKTSPILNPPTGQTVESTKSKQEAAKIVISAGCIQVLVYWVVAYLLW